VPLPFDRGGKTLVANHRLDTEKSERISLHRTVSPLLFRHRLCLQRWWSGVKDRGIDKMVGF